MEEILEAENDIEQAIYQLTQLEDVLEAICMEIRDSLSFDFAGISLVSLERSTIEAVHGIGIAKNWSGRAKHALEKDEDLRDIQADIVHTRRTKVISGWYKRFDRWLYEEFHHDKIVRVYSPIMVIQDRNGNIIDDWFDKSQWRCVSTTSTLDGCCTVYDGLSFPEEFEVIVIGTVEAGFENRQIDISDEAVAKLANLIVKKAIDIWKSQLPWVLKIITEKARQIMKAASATLHFMYTPEKNEYLYQVFSGDVGWRFLNDCPPRRDGIGRQAIHQRRYRHIPDPDQDHLPMELAKLNPKAFHAGIMALAAFPLEVDRDSESKEMILKEGVLYIAFHEEHRFTKEELRWGQLFANRAANAIRQATIYEQRRDREQLLTNLHSVAQSLADIPDERNLLRRIAWNALNIMAADIVTLYEYVQNENRFITLKKDRAGRFKAELKISENIQESAAPAKLVGEKENIYLSSLDEHPIYRDSNFAKQESIRSVAGLRLMVSEEIVGVMFINYRRPHAFTPEEIKIIETLSSSAAIAIKNQRWLTARSDIDRKIITTLDRAELLNLISEQAAKLTGAAFSSIRLHLDRPSEMLKTEAQYPTDTTNWIAADTQEGITGWVAKNRKPALVVNVRADRWGEYYKRYFPNIHSELCVPLIDKDRNLLGVINVQSHRIGAFNEKHQHMLEALSDQAVVGIQNIENKDRLVKMESMATLGHLACFLTHKIHNDVGAIRVFSRRLYKIIKSERQKNILIDIIQTADQIIQEVARLRDFVQDSSSPLDLYEIIHEACENFCWPKSIVLNKPQKKDGSILTVLGNVHPLIMVLDNLFNNALSAMPKGGMLTIEIHASEHLESDGGKWIEIQIKDTGIGIAKLHIGKIFDLGYTTKETGMGWGLWLSNYYVKSIGGHLSVESIPEQGTQFTVKLPSYNARSAENN